MVEIRVIPSRCGTGYNGEKVSELTQYCDERKQKCLASARVDHDSRYNLSEPVMLRYLLGELQPGTIDRKYFEVLWTSEEGWR